MLGHVCASAGDLVGALRAVWSAPELDAAGGALLEFRGYQVPRKAWRLANSVGVCVAADTQTGERWERTRALVRPWSLLLLSLALSLINCVKGLDLCRGMKVSWTPVQTDAATFVDTARALDLTLDEEVISKLGAWAECSDCQQVRTAGGL